MKRSEINAAIIRAKKRFEEYRISRPFRENIYKIKVYNPNGKETGVDYIVVDGIRIDSNKVEYKPDGKEHIVEVYM